MAIYKLRCPECAEQFKWPSANGWPKFCPLCKADVGIPEENEIAAPRILHAKSKSFDQTYRAMENGSEQRVQAAAEMTGLPASEFSDLKVTNMKDNAKEGESSDMTIKPDNQVAKFMNDHSSHLKNMDMRQVGIQASAQVSTGPGANAGAHMQKLVRSRHSREVPGGMSETPALETQQPGYMKRVH